jgi:hypothetical protein
MNARLPITNFKNDLAESHTATSSPIVWKAITRHFPGALNAHQCHVENDKRGADVIIELNGEKPVMVDLKTREKDFSYGRRDDIDVVIELTYGNKPGWATKETLADYYLFVCKDTGRSACFPAPELRQATVRHSEAWASTFKQLATITGGQYSNVVSHAVVVPANVVAQAIQLCDEGA